MDEITMKVVPRLLVTIIDRKDIEKLKTVLHDIHMRYFFTFNALGSANSEIMDVLGLDGSEKAIALCIVPSSWVAFIMYNLLEKMKLNKHGKGIAFTLPISGVNRPIKNLENEKLNELIERWEKTLDKEALEVKKSAENELIISIINQGFSDDVMEVAKAAGARGGTIFHARRISSEEMKKLFGISLQKEKEIIAIVAPKEKQRDIMQAINKEWGVRSEAKAIIFSVPVDTLVGIG